MSHESEIIWSHWDQIISFSWDIKWGGGDSSEPPLDLPLFTVISDPISNENENFEF